MTIRMPPVKHQFIALKGGWDLDSPSLSLAPGVLRDVLNYECAPTGGYRRIGGYERADGRPKPSDAVYSIVQVVSFTNTPSTGQTITQATSGATGYIVYVGANFMVVTKVTGAFDDSHAITTPGPVAVGTATAQTVAPTSQEDAQYTNLAADAYRADIAAVPGSGSVLGVVGATFSGIDYLYAFRANTGGTAVDLYKATASGWSQITFLKEVSFTVGAIATPLEEEVLTQGAVTATVKRVCTQSGTYAGGTAAGRFVVTAPAGGNFAAGAATLSGGATVTLSGVQTAITLTVGGKFEFAKGNFSGQLGTLRIYGCDGANRAFEFDGTTLVPITTGVSPDTPKHIAVHKNCLFLSVQSSVFYCGVGTPFRWLVADGGGEIATGDTVTNFLVLPGDQTTSALAVYCRSGSFVIYGSAASSFALVSVPGRTGGLDFSAQALAEAFVFDDRGVMTLRTSQAFGNFDAAALTHNIKPYILDKRTRIAYSTVSHERSQYRVFFSDGYALYLTVVNGRFIGATPIWFPNTVYCAWSGELSTGAEASYFGGTDGYVYELDVGSSFDGADLDAFITLAWDALGSARVLKRFRHAAIEMQGSSYAAVQFGYQLGYGSPEITQPGTASYTSGFQSSPSWDNFYWDDFFWDGQTISPTEVDLTGDAENIQVTISSTTDYILPFTINSLIIHYSPRRALR